MPPRKSPFHILPFPPATLAAALLCVAALAAACVQIAAPAPTPQPPIVATAAPTATPTPIPTPTPTATPTPTHTPTPTPLPAAYELDVTSVETGVAGDGLMEAVVNLTARNVGESANAEPLPLQWRVGGGVFQTVQVVENLPGGAETSIELTFKLPPGKHDLDIRMAGASASAAVDGRVADLAIVDAHHHVVEAGRIALNVEVANRGEIAAEEVAVAAEWTSDGGKREREGVVARLAPGASEELSLSIDVPSGSHTFTLTASTDTPEANTTDNTAPLDVEVDYVRLLVSVLETNTVGYDTDGAGIVEVVLFVGNDGEAASGPIEVGVVCEAATGPRCSASQDVESVAPGEGALHPPVHRERIRLFQRHERHAIGNLGTYTPVAG